MNKIGKKRSKSPDSDDYKDKDDSKKVKGPIKIKLTALSNAIKLKPTNPIPKSTTTTTTTIKATKSDTSLTSLKKAAIDKPKVAAIFNNEDSDDEPEEMPAECRMRMRNIGRDTPTSCGPNSFGKTKYGFCDSSKLFEKNLKLAMDLVSEDNKEE